MDVSKDTLDKAVRAIGGGLQIVARMQFKNDPAVRSSTDSRFCCSSFTLPGVRVHVRAHCNTNTVCSCVCVQKQKQFVQETRARITTTTDLRAAVASPSGAEADLVIEAIVENLEAKQALFTKLEAIARQYSTNL